MLDGQMMRILSFFGATGHQVGGLRIEKLKFLDFSKKNRITRTMVRNEAITR